MAALKNGGRSAMEDSRKIGNYVVDDFNPTFLFTWQGTRSNEKSNDSYHSHDFVEMAFVLSGTGRYLVEDEHLEIQEGDLLLFNAGVRHQAFYCAEAAVPATEFFVGFSDVQFQGLPVNVIPLPGGACILHTEGELRRKLFKICAAMREEKEVCRQGRYYMMKAYLIQMLLLVLREQCKPIERSRGYAFESVNKKYVVTQILDYFEDHYSEKISLDQIAENMYLSPFYISKIFKSETGDTPIRHLINIRLERAKELLETGWEGSIQEVAAAVGYDDAYHFSKLFKKRYGISPSLARKV